MRATSIPAIAVGVVCFLTVGLTAGCSKSTGGPATKTSRIAAASGSSSGGALSGAPAPGTSAASTPSTSPTSATASAHAQGEFHRVPSQCPSADEITLAVGISIPDVHPQTVGDALNCTYVNDANGNGPGVNITFGGAGIKDPVAAVAAWKANLKSFPNAVLVAGIGDGAVYYRPAAGSTAFNFISNGVSCNIYTGHFKSDQEHLANLAEFILEG